MSERVSSAAVLSDWAQLLTGSLAHAGVEQVVISPGSRSTPFAWAALETQGLTCHSVIDERAAAFFALGQARVTGQPSLLICTSGSAAAQYYPAVAESSLSAVPMLVLTADRPSELQQAGASQSLDQSKLYGAFVRCFLELGDPSSVDSALDGVVRMVSQAVAASLGPLPGPVHLNAKARKPLEPAETLATRAPSPAVERRLARGATRVIDPRPKVSAGDLAEVLELCRSTARGLIFCGPMGTARSQNAHSLLALARATGYPLVMEATSQGRFQTGLSELGEDCRVVGAFEALAAAGLLQRLAPELVIVLGGTPASAELERLLSSTDTVYGVVTALGHHDPIGKARFLVHSDPLQAAQVLAEELSSLLTSDRLQQAREYSAAWQQADEIYFSLLDQQLSLEEVGLSEPRAVRTVLEALPAGAWLGLGNSLPVREVDAFVRPFAGGLSVWSQRGLSGIDGLVAGAIGVASVAETPVITLLGDVSFLYDLSALALAQACKVPLGLVVIDNGGGRIFETLPIGRLLSEHPEHARYWLTPHEYDLSHAAALYRIPYHRAETQASLDAAVRSALAGSGCSLIHARVTPESCRRTILELRQLLTTRLIQPA